MKKLLLLLLCLAVFASLSLSAYAHEGHDHGTESTESSSVSIPNDLDLDADGIPDYMDGCIDIDGDGVADAGPTYQQPGHTVFKKDSDFPWLTVLIVGVFIGVVGATIYLKVSSKKKEN